MGRALGKMMSSVWEPTEDNHLSHSVIILHDYLGLGIFFIFGMRVTSLMSCLGFNPKLTLSQIQTFRYCSLFRFSIPALQLIGDVFIPFIFFNQLQSNICSPVGSLQLVI